MSREVPFDPAAVCDACGVPEPVASGRLRLDTATATHYGLGYVWEGGR